MQEQRCHAVLEVVRGAQVVEVAGRYGVSRQSVHQWLRFGRLLYFAAVLVALIRTSLSALHRGE